MRRARWLARWSSWRWWARGGRWAQGRRGQPTAGDAENRLTLQIDASAVWGARKPAPSRTGTQAPSPPRQPSPASTTINGAVAAAYITTPLPASHAYAAALRPPQCPFASPARVSSPPVSLCIKDSRRFLFPRPVRSFLDPGSTDGALTAPWPARGSVRNAQPVDARPATPDAAPVPRRLWPACAVTLLPLSPPPSLLLRARQHRRPVALYCPSFCPSSTPPATDPLSWPLVPAAAAHRSLCLAHPPSHGPPIVAPQTCPPSTASTLLSIARPSHTGAICSLRVPS